MDSPPAAVAERIQHGLRPYRAMAAARGDAAQGWL